jgi:hypothetical protein
MDTCTDVFSFILIGSGQIQEDIGKLQSLQELKPSGDQLNGEKVESRLMTTFNAI